MKTTKLVSAKLRGTTVLGRLFGGGNRPKEQRWVLPVAIVGVGIAAVAMIGLLYTNFLGLVQIGAASGAPDLAIYSGVVAAWAFVFLFGFPLAFSVLLFSKDTHLLISLPVRAYQVVLANVSVLYLYALPIAGIMFIPALVASASYVMGAGAVGVILYVVKGAVITLLLPAVPLMVALIFVTIIGRLFNVSRFRVGLEAIGMTVGVLGLVGLQLLLSRAVAVTGDDLTQQLQSIVEGLRSAVPPAALYSASFIGGGWLNLIGALAASLAVLVVAVALVQAGFVRQITEQGSVHRPKHYTPDASLPAARPPLRALITRELRLLTSNSTFLFESVGEVLIFPILFLVFRISLPAEQMSQIMPFLTETDYLFPIVAGVLLLLSGINSITSAGLSREGKSFNLSLMLPLPGSVQVAAKLNTYLLLFGFSSLVNATLATWILSQPWWWVPALFAVIIPYLVFVGAVTLFADLRRPMLTWSHPQQAVKQNVNVIIGMGATIVGVAVISAPAVFALLLGAGPAVVVLCGVGAALAVSPVLTRGVLRYADNRYAKSFDSGAVQGVRA